MSDTYKRREEPGGTSTVKGARAGERFKSGEDLDNEAAEAEYAKEQGATGLAGAARRSKPEYKTGLEAYKAARKKRTTDAAAAALATRK